MNTLRMKKFWDYNNTQLFSDRRFTAVGLEIYWKSIDSAFRHWDTFISGNTKCKLGINPATHRKLNKVSKKEYTQQRENDFIAREAEVYKRRQKNKKMPTPPPM